MATKKRSSAKRSAPKARVSAKKLTRSTSDRMVSGVLGGLASYLDVDSTLLRLAWLLIVAFTGFVPGIVVYVFAALVIPEK